MKRKLNIGCGLDIKPKEEGWTNLDQHKKLGADVVFDLNKIFNGEKLPFEDSSFDYILCSHVLEDFLDPTPIIEEMTRICKKGGLIEIRTPFETNLNLSNMHHKKPFTLSLFVSYIKEMEHYGEKTPLKIKELNYYTIKGKNRFANFLKEIVEKFYNLIGYRIVERSFIKYLFPVVNCRVVYRKIK